MEKYLAKMNSRTGGGWTIGTAGELPALVYTRPDGSSLRMILTTDRSYPWVVCNFGPDGNGTHWNAYPSFKQAAKGIN